MKKLYISLTLILVLIAGNFLLRHFHIKKLDEGINFINRALYKNGQELHYAAIEYKGYMFWDIEGNMKDISLEKKLQGLKELAEIKSINFKSNLIAQDLVIQSAQEFKITIFADDTKNIYLSSYQSQPELKIKFRKNALLLEIAHEISNQMDYVVENIQEVDFKAIGHEFKKILPDNSMILVETNKLTNYSFKNISSKDANGFKLSFLNDALETNENNSLDQFFLLSKDLKKTTMYMNFDYFFNIKNKKFISDKYNVNLTEGTPAHFLNINDFYLNTSPFNLKMQGCFFKDEKQIMPNINVKAEFKNINEFINYFILNFNYAVTSGMFKFMPIHEKEAELLKKLLLDCSEQHGDRSIIVFESSIDKKKLMIGKMDARDFFMNLQNILHIK